MSGRPQKPELTARPTEHEQNSPDSVVKLTKRTRCVHKTASSGSVGRKDATKPLRNTQINLVKVQFNHNLFISFNSYRCQSKTNEPTAAGREVAFTWSVFSDAGEAVSDVGDERGGVLGER